jgi:hypothetical protein
MVGLDFGVSDTGAPKGEPTRLVQGLPEHTLAALSVSGLGDRVTAAWGNVEQSGALAQFEEPLAELGLQLPDDLSTVLGKDLVVAVFGDPESPAWGARVVTEDPDAAEQIVDGLLNSPELDVPVVYAHADDGFALGTDQDTAFAMVGGKRGLGDTDAFRAAVADPDTASAIGYVDLATVVDGMVAQGGDTGDQAAKFSAVRALGFSATSTDEGGRFVLRITTR